jgi:hypothetical protein
MEPLKGKFIQHAFELPETLPLQGELKKYFKDDKWQTIDKYFEEGTSEIECAICLASYTPDDYKTNNVLITKCGHVFHITCHNNTRRTNCSICRKAFNNSDLEEWNELQTKVHEVFQFRMSIIGIPLKDSVEMLLLANKLINLSIEEKEQIEQDAKFAIELDEQLKSNAHGPATQQPRPFSELLRRIKTTSNPYIVPKLPGSYL